MKQTWQKKNPTKAQLKYWKLMSTRRGKDTPRWKGKSATKQSMHQWLHANVIDPKSCSNKKCDGTNKLFEWCLKRGRKYSHNPDDYLWLCRSCHRQYDLTPEKKAQAIKNLWWSSSHGSTTKLTPTEVKEIKRRLSNYSFGMLEQLAQEYDVSSTLIAKIKQQKVWTHI